MVSVVVPTHNRAAALRRLLNAVDAADAPEGGLEVVVVDDGSTDATESVIRGSRARGLHQQRAGPAAARESGWRAAAGDRIVFLDDDCVPRRDAIALLVEALDALDGAGATIVPIDSQAVLAQYIQLEGLVDHRVENGRVRWLATAAVAYRRDALEEVGGFDPAFRRSGEDVDLTLRLLAAGRTLGIEPRAVVAHDHRARLSDVAAAYFRHGTAQRLLSSKHAVHGTDNARTAIRRLSPREWAVVYRGYRREASIARSSLFLGLRAGMFVPYAAGAVAGQRGLRHTRYG